MPIEREIFTNLFNRAEQMRPIEFLRELTVLGLVNFYKWDRTNAWEEDHEGETIAAEELANIQFTHQEMFDYEATVRATLQDYVESVRPTRGFFYGVWQSVVGSFVYLFGVTILLLVAYFLFKWNDINLLEIFSGLIKQS